jgi:hypothetical protein
MNIIPFWSNPFGAQLLMSLAWVCHWRLMSTFWRTFIIDCIIRCLMIRFMPLVMSSGWHIGNECLKLEERHRQPGRDDILLCWFLVSWNVVIIL